MLDIFINFVVSFAASLAFYIYTEKIKNDKKQVTKVDTSKKYIKSIKLQFYLCFFISVPISIFRLLKISDSFANIFTSIMLLILFILMLFAFMCAIEVIQKLSSDNSNDSSDKNS